MAKKSKPTPIKDTLPATIVNSLPTSATIVRQITAACQQIPALDKELQRSKKSGAIALARSFVALHRLRTRIDAALKPLDEIFERYKTQEIPQAFEVEGITNVPLAEGFRVGVSSRLLASIPADNREAAYQWLRDHGLGDIISETVSAGTLSATAKTMMEDKNVELPSDLFKVAYVPNTSVVTT